MPTASKAEASASPAARLAGFVAKYDPAVARLVRVARAGMRRHLPTALELVYDNYQFLAIGYCATERASDCIVSLAVSPKGVSLCFVHGKDLPDPRGLLQGSGKQTRFLRLAGASMLNQPAVVALLRAATAAARTPLPKSGRGRTIIKSVSARQRPRRSTR
jgi:hypothetical protein